jgi:UDP-N-acetylglucosamine transferase subunit ALG13
LSGLRAFVTVGMGRWPFDRLVAAAHQLAGDHDVFIQSGTSTIAGPAPAAPFLAPSEFDQRIEWADVVITHGGNTVRTLQRSGRIPIAVAREAARGEMGNDHQVRYVFEEEATGRVVAAWGRLHRLPLLVAEHAATEARLARNLAGVPEPAGARLTLDELFTPMASR